MEAYGGTDNGSQLSSLNTRLGVGDQLTTLHFTRRKQPGCSLKRKLDGSQSHSEKLHKNPLPQLQKIMETLYVHYVH